MRCDRASGVTDRAARGHYQGMKSSLLIAALGLCLTAPLWAQTDDASTPPPPPPPGEHHMHGGPPLSQDEMTELKSAHEAALKDNPDLATEGKQLHEQMRAFMKKMHDAMVKADPKVGPILDKMKEGHPHDGPPPAPGGDDDSGQ